MIRALVIAVIALLASCGAPAGGAVVASIPTPTPTHSPSPSPSPSPPASPSPSPEAAAQPPVTIAVSFSRLPNGNYPTHLHSICDGRQAFHITVLQTLVVRGGSGSIEVPSGYFGRGLCVIVYSSPSLTGVLATRRI